MFTGLYHFYVPGTGLLPRLYYTLYVIKLIYFQHFSTFMTFYMYICIQVSIPHYIPHILNPIHYV